MAARSTVGSPQSPGAGLWAADTTTLATLSTDGITPGTKCYVQASGRFYTFKIAASPDVAAAGVSGAGWMADSQTAIDAGTRVTAGADGTTLSLTVTGASDGGYKFDGIWQAGTGGDTDLLLQINGVATGYTTFSTFAVTGDSTFRSFTYTGNFGGGANAAGVAIGRAGGGASHAVLFFSGSITPSTNGSLADVKVEARACDAAGVLFEIFFSRSAVLLAADVTQIALVTSGGGNTIKQNSYLRVQKQGFTA